MAHRLEIYQRAYRILVEELGYDPADLIFDPSILTVATGMEEHDDYARTYLESPPLLKERFPRVKVSGGVSNISFSFRGNAYVREAMHAAFLYHANRAGLDMAIVNAGRPMVYEDIPAGLLERVEDILPVADSPPADLVPYIDWSPFFHVRELRGAYPRVLDDEIVEGQARELFDYARRMLDPSSRSSGCAPPRPAAAEPQAGRQRAHALPGRLRRPRRQRPRLKFPTG